MLTTTALAAAAARCSGNRTIEPGREMQMPAKTIEQVLEEHTDELLAVPGVVGTAIGLRENQKCIKVYVVEQGAELSARIPPMLDGYRVVLEPTGEIRALDDP